MKWFANAYIQALGQFAVEQVAWDAVKSVWLVIKQSCFVLASAVWILLSPFLAFIEVIRPGSLDRLLLRLSR